MRSRRIRIQIGADCCLVSVAEFKGSIYFAYIAYLDPGETNSITLSSCSSSELTVRNTSKLALVVQPTEHVQVSILVESDVKFVRKVAAQKVSNC